MYHETPMGERQSPAAGDTLFSPSPAIEATALTKSFGRVKAVRGLSLTVGRGEIFGLIGPDGAGKTTAIRLLAGVMLPSQGEVRVLGHDTRQDVDKVRRSIGYMPQRFRLYGDLSVIENINFFADVFGVRGAERRNRSERLLAFTRLGEFSDRRAAQLSGGMQKKLALACTLIHTPEVIFLDEPTTGVDPISRREFWNILADLHVQGVTLFVSTPYMDEAERCSRVGLMYDGEIVECDRPDVLRTMVPGELLAIWTTELLPARRVLEALPEVLEVQTYGDLLHVFVKDAQAMRPLVCAALADSGVTVVDAKQSTPRVEEAFISLLRKRQGGREQAPRVSC